MLSPPVLKEPQQRHPLQPPRPRVNNPYPRRAARALASVAPGAVIKGCRDYTARCWRAASDTEVAARAISLIGEPRGAFQTPLQSCGKGASRSRAKVLCSALGEFAGVPGLIAKHWSAAWQSSVMYFWGAGDVWGGRVLGNAMFCGVTRGRFV